MVDTTIPQWQKIAVDLKQTIIEEERHAERTKIIEVSQSQAEETGGTGDDMDTDSKTEVSKPTDLTVEVVDAGKEITAQEWEDLKPKEEEGAHMDNTDGPPVTVNEDGIDGNMFKTLMASPMTPSPGHYGLYALNTNRAVGDVKMDAITERLDMHFKPFGQAWLGKELSKVKEMMTSNWMKTTETFVMA